MYQAPHSESFDCVRQSVVILLGTLARHLDKNDPKIKPIAAKLTEALSTPSQQVFVILQYTISLSTLEMYTLINRKLQIVKKKLPFLIFFIFLLIRFRKQLPNVFHLLCQQLKMTHQT